ncbi:MAG: TIGR03745 family integrating conjugative element membrane protein [Burkholderiales bacterium]|jgi:integrating conjugative element membrane protein (TIGR03745 family)|nr:TIGR03745 family integrating conjugative element membrane protein [Burkholderiales bacterium]
MKFANWMKQILASFGAMVFASAVMAQGSLPTVEDPSRGTGSGIRQTMQNHMYDWGVIAGLAIAAIAFIVVAYYAIQVFTEVQNQKKKWADFGMVLVVGFLLLVLIIWLLTKAAEIL